MFRSIRKGFAILIAGSLFLFLAYVFTLFLNPQNATGLGFSAVLVLLSAGLAIYVYGWIAGAWGGIGFSHRPHPDMLDKGWGVGLVGLGQARRRDPDIDDGGTMDRRRGDSGDDDFDDDQGLF